MIPNIVSAVKNIDWKAFLKGPLFVVIIGGLCFIAGRSTSPEKIKTVQVDKVVEVHHEQTQVAQQINIDELLKKVQDKTRFVDRDVIKIVTTKPDGTRIETETDKSHIDSTQHTTVNSETKASEVSEIKQLLDSYKQEDHSKTTIVSNSNKWKIGGLGGYGKNSSGLITGVPGLIVGAFVEKRVFWGLSGGVWASSQPGIGLQFSYSF
jgi:Skp family chaperone for outer membrane proteins